MEQQRRVSRTFLAQKMATTGTDQQAAGLDQKFVFGDVSTFPVNPWNISPPGARGFLHVDQRDNNLWMDAGIATTQADWSLDFDIGMNFMEWHGPVPLATSLACSARPEIPAEPAAGKTRAPPELDHDDQPTPRYQPGKLPEMGAGPRHRDAGKCWQQGAFTL
jgi:hypothetical protein